MRDTQQQPAAPEVVGIFLGIVPAQEQSAEDLGGAIAQGGPTTEPAIDFKPAAPRLAEGALADPGERREGVGETDLGFGPMGVVEPVWSLIVPVSSG